MNYIQEGSKVHITGDTRDTIYYKDGRVEVVESHNLVVNSILPLIMSLLKRDAGKVGIQYWAVGKGASSWDTSPIEPKLTDTTLTSEIGRKAINTTDISFLTTDTLVVTTTPTNIIQVTTTFGATECNGDWREFGLFGGNATATLNSGIMINRKHHKIITKTAEMVVERNIRFTINLS